MNVAIWQMINQSASRTGNMCFIEDIYLWLLCIGLLVYIISENRKQRHLKDRKGVRDVHLLLFLHLSVTVIKQCCIACGFVCVCATGFTCCEETCQTWQAAPSVRTAWALSLRRDRRWQIWGTADDPCHQLKLTPTHTYFNKDSCILHNPKTNNKENNIVYFYIKHIPGWFKKWTVFIFPLKMFYE